MEISESAAFKELRYYCHQIGSMVSVSGITANDGDMGCFTTDDYQNIITNGGDPIIW